MDENDNSEPSDETKKEFLNEIYKQMRSHNLMVLSIDEYGWPKFNLAVDTTFGFKWLHS